MRNYYKELGLDPKLNKKKIEAKLIELHRRVRSKADSAPNRKKRTEAYERLEIIEEALDILLDDKKRKEYDNRLLENEDDSKDKDIKKDDSKLSYLSNSTETYKSSDVDIINERIKSKETKSDKKSKTTIGNHKQTILMSEDENIKLDDANIEKFKKMTKDLEDKLDREIERRGYNKESSKSTLNKNIEAKKTEKDKEIKENGRNLQEKEWSASLEEVNALHEKIKKREKIKKTTERNINPIASSDKNSINQSSNNNLRSDNMSQEIESNISSTETEKPSEKGSFLGYILAFMFSKTGFVLVLVLSIMIFLTINPQYRYIFDSEKYTMYKWIKKYDYTKLHWYIEKEDIELAIKEIEKKKDINKKNNGADTPLHLAVKKGNTELVSRLIEAGADPNIKDQEGNTPIFYANNKELVESLISAGADVNIINNNGETPIFKYSSHNNNEILTTLLDNGADLTIVNNNGESMLDVVFQCYKYFNNEERDELLLKLLDAGAVYGEKTLEYPMLLLYDVDIQITKRLIDMGADVNKTNEEGGSVLHTGVFYNALEEVKLLIKNGADVNAKDNENTTPLNYLGNAGYEMVKLLIDNGADVNTINDRGQTPMFWANDKETIRLFIQKGLKVNIADKTGLTPLHIKASDNKSNPVAELIKQGADVNAKDENGITPLHRAIMFYNIDEEHEKIVKLLLEAGADVSMEANNGNTPLDCATKDEKQPIEDIFKKYSK